MTEPLAVCLHAGRRAGELLGKRVLITGAGPIGTLSVLVVKAAGAAEIVVTDLVDPALAYARRVGAGCTINISTDSTALAEYQAGKGSFDVLFECSGTAPTLAGGIAAMRPRGVILQLGLGGDMTIPMQALAAKELDLRGAFRFHEEFAMAVALMQTGAIDVKPLISHTVATDEAVADFKLAANHTQSMKTQINFS